VTLRLTSFRRCTTSPIGANSAVGRAASAAEKGKAMSKDYEDQAKQRELDRDFERAEVTRQQVQREWQEELARLRQELEKRDKPQ
jgi:hypothetical protein